MKTEPRYPRQRLSRHRRRTCRLLMDLLIAFAILAGVMALAGCTVTVSPDGSKSATVDAPSAIRVIEVLAAK